MAKYVSNEIEGIIYNDMLLSKKEFIKAFTDEYEKNSAEIDYAIFDFYNYLSDLKSKGVKNLRKNNIEEFDRRWTRFQREVLKNEIDLSLLVAYRDTKSFTSLEKEEKVHTAEGSFTSRGKTITQAGIDTKKMLEKVITAQDAEEFLNEHYDGLYQKIFSEKFSKNDAERAHRLASNKNKDIVNNFYRGAEKQHFTNRTWSDIMWGGLGYPQKVGRAYDAFFNHMANFEAQIFTYLASQGNMDIKNIKHDKTGTVYIQEGGEENSFGHFPHLLAAASNRTAWYSGGDVNIIDENKALIYKIQIKSTTAANPSTFSIRISDLQKNIMAFATLLADQGVKKAAEKLYEEFKTSAYKMLEEKLTDAIDDLTDPIEKFDK